MNTNLKILIFQQIKRKKDNKGFTLIELLVVIIIIGVLAAIALPNLLAQVAKGRQSEARNNLGMLNRIQEAYRWEHGVFAPDEATLGVSFSWLYYDLTFNSIPSGEEPLAVTYYVQAKTTYQNDILDYGAGAMQSEDGVFYHVVCEELDLNSNNNTAPNFADFANPTLSCDITRSKQVK